MKPEPTPSSGVLSRGWSWKRRKKSPKGSLLSSENGLPKPRCGVRWRFSMTVTLTTAGPTCSTRPVKSARPTSSGVAGVPTGCGESAAGAAAGDAVDDCGAQALNRVVIRTIPTRRWEATYVDIDELLQLCRRPPRGPERLPMTGMIPRPARFTGIAAHSAPLLPGRYRQREQAQEQYRPVTKPQVRG